MKAVSEEVLRTRVSDNLDTETLQDLIDRYVEAASLEECPNMDLIAELVEKRQEDKLLRVSFTLEPEQYDSLAAYFGESERPGSVLVRNALTEFISIIT